MERPLLSFHYAPGMPEAEEVTMRHLLLSGPLLTILAVAGPACVAADEPTSTAGASNTFEVPMTPHTTAETVIPQILAAGHDELASICAANPTASMRVFNPLASGS
jgi:hypothetical protein